jgi:hypothetical protein
MEKEENLNQENTQLKLQIRKLRLTNNQTTSKKKAKVQKKK